MRHTHPKRKKKKKKTIGLEIGVVVDASDLASFMSIVYLRVKSYDVLSFLLSLFVYKAMKFEEQIKHF